MLHFDWTINPPVVFAAVSVVGIFVKAHIQNLERLTRIEEQLKQLNSMYQWWINRHESGRA